MMNLVQLAVFAFFVKRVHDCGVAGWVGAMARVFGWSLLSGFLAGVIALFGALALAIIVGRVINPRTARSVPGPFKAGSLELEGPWRFAAGAVVVVLQVLLMLLFTRCA
jgi:hypothetical protein